VAFIERLAYDVLDRVTGSGEGEVFSTGAASRSDVWMQCRADATRRVMHRPACGESAFGSAVLAAVGTCFPSLAEAIETMVRVQRTFIPNDGMVAEYEGLFRRFSDELIKRGYR
jgi:sugar (pentulose or hexulose) kinase